VLEDTLEIYFWLALNFKAADPPKIPIFLNYKINKTKIENKAKCGALYLNFCLINSKL
jgi:hypothetical protein